MVTDVETLVPGVHKAPPSQDFNAAVLNLRRDVQKEAKSRPGEAMPLEELLKKVRKWEIDSFSKLSNEEVEALATLSLVLQTIKVMKEKKNIGGAENLNFAFGQMVSAQRDAVRTIFNNLDENGRPNQMLLKSFGLVTTVFEELLNPERLVMRDKGLPQYASFWQGVMGMCTAAQMFQQAGWEVSFPPEKLDIKYGADFVVKDPKGEMYTVDVSASIMPKDIDFNENRGKMFYVKKRFVRQTELFSYFPGLKGTIRLNVPPLWHNESEEFYDRNLRGTGFPSERSMEKFQTALG